MHLEIKIPYLPELGKNKIKGFFHGRYFTNPSYKKAVKDLSEIIFMESKNERLKWENKKIWVNIFLQKPRMRCDVANLVDGIFDAIKVGIGIDDCYFSLIADWKYEKDIEPFIILEIKQ